MGYVFPCAVGWVLAILIESSAMIQWLTWLVSPNARVMNMPAMRVSQRVMRQDLYLVVGIEKLTACWCSGQRFVINFVRV